MLLVLVKMSCLVGPPNPTLYQNFATEIAERKMSIPIRNSINITKFDDDYIGFKNFSNPVDNYTIINLKKDREINPII